MVLMMSRRPKEEPTNPATGAKYSYEMVYDGGRVAYGETYPELCRSAGRLRHRPHTQRPHRRGGNNPTRL